MPLFGALHTEFSSPEIHLASEVIAERREKIVCSISNLKLGNTIPPINVTLLGDGHILNTSYSKSSVEYSFVAQPKQEGAEILCLASLQVGKEVLHKKANRTLKVWGKFRLLC